MCDSGESHCYATALILLAFRFKYIFRKGTLYRYFLGFIKQMLPMCVSMVTKYIQLAEMVSIDFMT